MLIVVAESLPQRRWHGPVVVFDNPIFFLILISVISAISDWLGKRRKAKQLQEEQEQSGGMEPVLEGNEEMQAGESRRTISEQKQEWEERLRRMLEGDGPGEESRSPVATRVEPPSSAPTSRTEPSVLEVDETFIEPVRTEIPVPPVMAPRIPEERPEPHVEPSPASVRGSGVGGWKKGRSIESMKPRGPIGRRQASMISQLRSKKAIRQAIIASVVLGAPKGTGEESDLIKL